MINPDMIPPEAVEAAARAIAESLRTARLTMECEDGYKPEARAAIAAALNAWPESKRVKGYFTHDADNYGEDTVLDNRSPPPFKPGDDMVWVRYNGCWFAAERQALFVGTQKALHAHGIQQAPLP